MADNWYIVLGLEFDPPVKDERIIDEKIEECKRYWSSHAEDYKMGVQYRTWMQNVPQIRKDMLGTSNIRKRLAEEACSIVYASVDKYLKTIGRKGNITSEEGNKLSKKTNFSIDIIKKRAGKLGLSWVEGTDSDYRSVYDKYYNIKPQKVSEYDGMKQMLSSFGVHNLYDFLYEGTGVKNANRLPYDILAKRAAEKKKKEFYKTDNISGIGAKLCAKCKIAFSSEENKNIYDMYLDYIKRRAILEDVKNIAEISGELTFEQGEEIIEQLTLIFRDRNLSVKVLTAFCKIEKISYNAGAGNERSHNIKICRCGCINDVSNGRKVCSNCGLELVIKCPNCGSENDSNIKVCGCGFKFENIDKAVALCEQAEHAIEALEFEEAKKYLINADDYWPFSNKISELKERLHKFEKRVGANLTELQEAVKSKRYWDAQRRYLELKKIFPFYSDNLIEDEIIQAVEQAKNLLSRAKTVQDKNEILKLCENAYALCHDLPGIRELIPEPDRVTGFQVIVNPVSRSNIVNWKVADDRSIRYAVVRSSKGWIQSLSDGELVYSGSASSFEDKEIEAGIIYYYNVFAERAGIYSKGAAGKFNEVINLFEISGVAVTAADTTLNITWDTLPKNAKVEIYQIQENKKNRCIAICESDSYLVTGLRNGENYYFQITLLYSVQGRQQETKGIIVSGRPECLPQPIDTLQIKFIKEGRFEAVWTKPDMGEVRLYGSVKKPEYLIGDIVSITQLEQKMTQLQQQHLNASAVGKLKMDEAGAVFQYSGKERMYVTAVTVKGNSAVFGNIAHISLRENVIIKDIRMVNGKINIYMHVPAEATGFIVLYRLDHFPYNIGDMKTIRKYVPIKQYELNNAIVLDNLEEREYYFSIYAEFKQEGEKDYSSGAEYLFDNSCKNNISYSISVNKKIFGESNIMLEFDADSKEFILPDIEIMSAIGKVPMFKAAAKLFHTIPSQAVNGKIEIKIPIPKDIQKDTYIKAFFKNEEIQRKNQLKLKFKSDYKIS